MSEKLSLLKQLISINCLKFGEFTLKSGAKSPIYIDLRQIVSHPIVLEEVSERIWQVKVEKDLTAELICGVPYTALPMASYLSVVHRAPMVLRRKEAKGYGTNKMVEGTYKPGQTCLVIEDIVTTGSSVLETAEILKKEGLVVTDCIVVLNRGQGGEANLNKAGIKMHSLFNLHELVPLIRELNLVQKSVLEDVEKYLKDSHIEIKTVKPSPLKERAETSCNLVIKKLYKIVEEKKTNLCISVDVTSKKELLEMAEKLGPYMCILKTHIDILKDFDSSVPVQLQQIAKRKNFLILEDRKFADIGNTVLHQYQGGLHEVQKWADIVTVHSIPGDGIIQALKQVSSAEQACVLIAQMSSRGALTCDKYTKDTVVLAEQHKDFVMGFISQTRLSGSSPFIYISPGVSLNSSGDNLGQQYRTVDQAMVRDGADIVVVGRGITAAKDIAEAAEIYCKKSYEAYLQSA